MPHRFPSPDEAAGGIATEAVLLAGKIFDFLGPSPKSGCEHSFR